MRNKKTEIIYQQDNLQVLKTAFHLNLADLAQTLSEEEPFVLLDSCGVLSEINQWSFLGCQPKAVVSFKNGVFQGKGYRVKGNGLFNKSGPLGFLRKVFAESKPSGAEKLTFSPYIGGPIGYFSYDIARYIEKLPQIAEDDLNLPDFYFIVPSLVYAHNLITNELYIFNYCQPGELSQDLGNYQSCIRGINNSSPNSYNVKGRLRANMTKQEFESAVSKIRSHIYAGDVYQVNFSQRFEADFEGSCFALYKHLSKINPGPFCGYLKAQDFSIISSSPERLVCARNNHLVQTRPIAGTRRRGRDEYEDDLLSGNLLLDEKERAEHIMLVDLERNDLGKVCNYSSVKVDELMTLEKYSHVIHIVSNVQGVLHKDRDQFDLVKAMFPGGTITGCPKVRCMEIIERLEPTRRGPYTGSLGYLSYNGNIDFNILIRTIARTAGKIYIQAGAGVVADSIPEREYFETISKAQALFRSVGHSLKEKQWEKMSI